MIWRLPTFNVVANVWHGRLPALTDVGFSPLSLGTPDLVTVAQLYGSRYGCSGFFHLVSNDIRRTLERAGYMQLRVPKNTDLRAPWMPTAATTWADLDIVECPAGSKRFYVVIMVDNLHTGFVNEYRFGVLAQLDASGRVVELGGGGGLEAIASPGTVHVAELGSGGGIERFSGLFIPAELGSGGGLMVAELAQIAAELGSGGGMEIAFSVPPLVAELGSGGGLEATASPGTEHVAELGSGLGLEATASPGTEHAAELGSGGGLEVTDSFTAGSVTPGTTCAGAATVTLPFANTASVASPNSHWYKFTGVGGTQYHIDISGPANCVSTASLETGGCPTPTPQATATIGMGSHAAFTLASSGVVLIHILGGLSAGSYTVSVGTGP